MYREVLGKFAPNKHRYTQETLEKKHNVKIGDRVKVSMNVASAGKDAITEKVISCRIIGLYENLFKGAFSEEELQFIKDTTIITPKEELEMQQYRDKVKMDYVLSIENYHYLAIPYTAFKDNSYKTLIDNKISEILSLTT